MFGSILITGEERKTFLKWTALDEDLTDVEPDLADAMLKSRLDFARRNFSRTDYGMILRESMSSRISNMDDGTSTHRLDLYLPHDSVVKGGKTTPVYIDIHGGGFVSYTRTSTAIPVRISPSRDSLCFL